MKDSDLKTTLNELIVKYADAVGTNGQGAIRDILTSLRFIADEQGVDFQFVVESSEAVYDEEVEMDSLNASVIEHVNLKG
jgi:hypothetical protein